ncbi:hypothetical protein F5Y09DRAFT_352597 [Xylaria sp. FL1042]|nr:hypothetical protein F5Y09DRAFT_352597 [Xylaria sp. FL1042]
MGEPLSWLKLGQRARTPTTPLTANPLECKATRDSQSCDPRRPGSSRMSTRTPPEARLEAPSTDEGAADFLVRDQDQVWYNPSLDQMVEALQVLLMTHGVLEPIPIQYNSYILHLVEGFAVAQGNIRKAEAAYQEARRSLEQNLEQFRLVADEWLERESQYRAEVKRLEVLLSKCSRSGLEAVALARTNSIVDRSGPEGAGFLWRLDKLRKHHVDGLPPPRNVVIANQACRTEIRENQCEEEKNRTMGIGGDPDRVPTPKILDNDNDYRMSEKILQQYVTTRASTASREWWAHRRNHTSRPELDVPKRCQDDSRNHCAGIMTIPTVASGSHQIHQEGQLPTKTNAKEGKEDASSMPAFSTPDLPTYAKGSKHDNVAAATETASARHERDHSPFSFETGDDFDLFPKPTEGEKGDDTPYPSHKSRESTGIGTQRRYGDDTTSLTASKEQSPSTENGDPTIHLSRYGHARGGTSPRNKPGRGHRDAVHGRHTTMGGSPGQSSHSLDPPLAVSPAEQEASQRQQAETNARIAATLALANVLGRTSQNK